MSFQRIAPWLSSTLYLAFGAFDKGPRPVRPVARHSPPSPAPHSVRSPYDPGFTPP